MKVGVLALQGDVREHERMLLALGAQVTRVRRPGELAEVDGIVIPGGESSVIDKLVRDFDMRDPLRDAIARGMPVYGTCAGLIMLADRLTGAIDGQRTLGGLDITVARNAFGSQVDSFEAELDVDGFDGPPVRAAFIRAPLVVEAGPSVQVLARLPDGGIVQGAVLGTSFHPEVSGETRFHERFITNVRRA